MHFLTLTSVVLFASQVLAIPSFPLPRDATHSIRGSSYSCKCYDGDSCWPSASKWKSLNTTVGGRLKKVIPAAAVCYNFFEGIPTYNATACAAITVGQFSEDFTIAQDVSPMRTLYTNNTCNPTNDPTQTCSIGYLSEYVILAETKEHVAAGVKFANTYNLRLLVRNTGHDFMGRSVGSGALAINTHRLKGVAFTKKYTGAGTYTGSAVKVGTGVQGRELYRQAFAQSPKVVVVGGECPTVGFAGGYLLGGGHGPLATYHGMGADQVLEFEMVTAKGTFVTANECENEDLFWALKGGGPATFGIVTSVTVKTFPELPTAGTIININATHTTNHTLFWQGVEAFHSLANHYVDNGMFVYYELTEGTLHIQPFVAPNMNAAQLGVVLAPLFAKLKSLGVPFSTVTKEFPTFFELYIDMFEDEAAGGSTVVGGRMFARKDIEDNSSGIIQAFQTATLPPDYMFGILIGHIVGPGHGAPVVDNAINPRWRTASSFSISMVILPDTAGPVEKAAAQSSITNTIDAALIAASPNGAAYVNEGNLEQPNWQTEYWGSNYPRLYKIRQIWDPTGLFYAATTVGTEKWSEIGNPPKLCKSV